MITGKEYHKTLPTKRMAAGALISDAIGRLLIVQPTYKSEWEIPGGVVERFESPLAAVIRELKEEVSLDLTADAFTLASVDYLDESESRTEALMFLFRGPTLDGREIEGIRIDQNEIRSFDFLEADAAAALLGTVVGPRLLRAVQAVSSRTAVYYDGRG